MTELINPNYKFPEYYSWPFFFTIQKHGETRRKQLLMWTDLILNFCKDNKVWRLSKSVFYENLGKNPKVNRKLPIDSVEIIFSFMIDKKSAMYVNEKKVKMRYSFYGRLWLNGKSLYIKPQ